MNSKAGSAGSCVHGVACAANVAGLPVRGVRLSVLKGDVVDCERSRIDKAGTKRAASGITVAAESTRKVSVVMHRRCNGCARVMEHLALAIRKHYLYTYTWPSEWANLYELVDAAELRMIS